MSKEILDTQTPINLFISDKCPIRLIKTGEVTDNWTITKSGHILAEFSNGEIIYPYAHVDIFHKDRWINFEYFRESIISFISSIAVKPIFD